MTRSESVSWVSLGVSVLTLVAVLAMVTKPVDSPPDLTGDLSAIEARLDDLGTSVRRLEESVGESSFFGPRTGLHAELDVLTDALSNSATADDVEVVRDLAETIEARLSDVCFRLDAC